jgi:hypothetical protein
MKREKMYAYKALVRKPQGKRSLGRSRCRWLRSIKMDFE